MTRFDTIALSPYRVIEWSAVGHEFAVRANIADELNQFGPGVYLINVYYYADGVVNLLSSNAIFLGIDRPTTYDRWATPSVASTGVPAWTPTDGPTLRPTSNPFVLATPANTETPADRTR